MLLYYFTLYHIISYYVILYYVILYYIILIPRSFIPIKRDETLLILSMYQLRGLFSVAGCRAPHTRTRVVYWLNIWPISTPCVYHLPPMSPSNPDKMGTWQWINWLSPAASKIEDSKISLSFIRSSIRSSRLGSTGGKWSRILQCQKLAGNLSFLLQRLNYAKWVR